MKFVQDGIEVSTTVDLPIIGTREIREVIKYDEFKGKLLISNISVNRNKMGGIADISFNVESPPTTTIQTTLTQPVVRKEIPIKSNPEYALIRRTQLLHNAMKICDFHSITGKPYQLYLSADKSRYIITGENPHTYVMSFVEYQKFLTMMPLKPIRLDGAIDLLKKDFGLTGSWSLLYTGVALSALGVTRIGGKHHFYKK